MSILTKRNNSQLDKHSVSCRFLDIGSLNQLSNEQNGGYPSKHVHLCKMFHKEKYLSLEKVLNGFLKETAYKGGYIIGFFNPLEKNLRAEKRYTDEWDYYSI